jgi:hypothetical protein
LSIHAPLYISTLPFALLLHLRCNIDCCSVPRVLQTSAAMVHHYRSYCVLAQAYILSCLTNVQPWANKHGLQHCIANTYSFGACACGSHVWLAKLSRNGAPRQHVIVAAVTALLYRPYRSSAHAHRRCQRCATRRRTQSRRHHCRLSQPGEE